jgi:probable DNA metabolism protein
MRFHVQLEAGADFERWRDLARGLLNARCEPDQVSWNSTEQPELLGGSNAGSLPDVQPNAAVARATSATRVPRQFVEAAQLAYLHAHPERFAFVYRVLWRLTHGESQLLELAVDGDVVRLHAMTRAVQRDMHKMKAFVRFKETPLSIDAQSGQRAEPWFVAWFEPEHHILGAVAPFFMRRFSAMRFSIMTPEASVHWDTKALAFGPGGAKADLPEHDAGEDLWRTYYASIFNPARLKLAAMQNEMPKKYWKNLPEAALIAELSSNANQRSNAMIDAAPSNAVRRPPKAGTSEPAHLEVRADAPLAELKHQATTCRLCDLWRDATKTVFGEGPAHARIMLVGEQPGDQEDLTGHPFVGPAGQLLDRALQQAGVERAQLYVTNAVKHFKFVVRGKRRLHQSPKVIEVQACSNWLMQEIELVQPSLIVALGATAAHALLNRATPIKANRGTLIPFGRASVLVTLHPSYLLRLPDAATREHEESLFVGDLRLIAAHIGQQPGD